MRGVFPSQLRTLPVFSTFSDMLNRPRPGWICAIRQGVLGDVGLPCLLGLPLRLMTEPRRTRVDSVATTMSRMRRVAS